MKIKRLFLLACAGCAAVCLLIITSRRPTRPQPDGEHGDRRLNLQARVASMPKPALARLPKLAAARQATQPAATPAAAARNRILTEAELEPLRRGFSSPIIAPRADLPLDRQVLLANRLLVAAEDRILPTAPSGTQTPSRRGTTPFVVQFEGPVTDASRAALAAVGAIVRDYYPHQALLAEFTPDALARLSEVEHVRTAFEYLPADKIQPFLSFLKTAVPEDAHVAATIQTFAPEDVSRVAAAVAAAGGEVTGSAAGTRWGTVRAIIPLGALSDLAARGDVQWLEEHPLIAKRNDQAAAAPHLNSTNAWNVWRLTGKGQIVGHADTGLDTGVPDTIHPDFRCKIVTLIGRGRPNDPSDLDGHGTHTAGSILGTGAASSGKYRGQAPDARLVHQSVVDAAGMFTGLGADLYELFAESYNLGACIHSDSWGADTYGYYDSDCRSTDLFAWDHPDHLAVFACGNAGRDSDRNGVIDTGNVGSPATAKNVLAVGATENDRPSGSGGYTSYRWGTGWPSKYPVSPIYSDYISYSYTTSPYRQGLAAFSSRGPAADGRIKPELVAPGTDVISTKSSIGQAVWADLASNPRYCFGGGTSMATPQLAGAAALMRQYAVERGGVTNPSAALLKAMLVGGARSLTPGQYGTGSYREIPAASPNNVEGWGQPDLVATVHPSNRMVRLIDRLSPSHGETNTFSISVLVSNKPLDVALAWIDYPAAAGAGVTQVNDLDLLVTTPGGATLYPNGGSARDDINTVETVRIAAAETGVYTIRVIGQTVPYAGLTAALYVRGAIDSPPVLIHSPLTASFTGTDPYPVDCLVQSLSPLTNGEVRAVWAAGNASAATGEWQSVLAVWLGGAAYRAELPSQAVAGYIYYYLRAETGGYDVTLPEAASEQAAYRFLVGDPVELIVEGSPARYGDVVPAYGTNILVAGAPYLATASTEAVISNGLRRLCAGWAGAGDVPPSGASNRVTLVLEQPSAMIWLWSAEYALTNRYRLADTGQLFGERLAWYPAGTFGKSDTAIELGFVGDTPYAFCGWTVDGARWPDATSAGPNPATDILMNRTRLAQGDYLPFWQDSDGNGLSDWWELRYFGSTVSGAAAGDDLDGDLWTNLAEFLDNTDPRDPSSEPTPPAIAVQALNPFQSEHPPWTVLAIITDNLTVEQALLVWRERGDSAWQTNDMTWVSNDVFQAQLVPPSYGAKRVDYYVWSCDLIGYYDPQFGSASPVYSVLGDYEYAWMTVKPADLGLLELSETATNLALTVSNLAGPDLLWTARVARAHATYAAAAPGWTHSGNNDVWCVTTNRTWNGVPVWYCGNPATRQYPNGCHAKLDTPPFLVGAGGAMLWRQWIKTEYDRPGYYWDGAVIRVSADGGATFALVQPTAGYPCRIVNNPDSPFPADQPCLAGSGAGWETLIVDLAAYAGQTVIIRFEFGSDLYVTDEGWYVAGVTPLSFDAAPAPWLVPQGAWGGLLPDQWDAGIAFTADPAGLACDAEELACIRVSGDDPLNQPLVPLTVRRGHTLHLSSVGPGQAYADRTFLFRGNQAIVTLQADPGAYLYAVTINGVPQPGFYDFETVSKTLLFSNVAEDQLVQAWFAYRTWTLSVYSDFGSAEPATGTHTFTHGTMIQASVTSPILLPGGLSRQACSGWLLTGHADKFGTGNQMSFTLTNDAALVWLWETNHWLTAIALTNGSVAPSGGWYVAGQTACVTAQPSAFYRLALWAGDTDGALQSGDELRLPMTRPRTVVAVFSARLTPPHHVPEWWLAGYGWTQDFEAAAESDSDGDGLAAWQEWKAGTDPTNALSVLKVIGFDWSNSLPRLVWTGGSSKTQWIERAAGLAGPWVAIHTNLPPTPVTNLLTPPAYGAKSFYRVKVP